jgi:hypothetical protein
MTARLSALVKRVAELRWASFEVCHYVEEFHLRRIRLSIIGRNWHMSAQGWPIPTDILLRVRF